MADGGGGDGDGQQRRRPSIPPIGIHLSASNLETFIVGISSHSLKNPVGHMLSPQGYPSNQFTSIVNLPITYYPHT